MWDKFFKSLMDPKKAGWDVLVQADCIIGGADMSLSYV
jgi:hypothetical protein